jgi:hypothetical protein
MTNAPACAVCRGTGRMARLLLPTGKGLARPWVAIAPDVTLGPDAVTEACLACGGDGRGPLPDIPILDWGREA